MFSVLFSFRVNIKANLSMIDNTNGCKILRLVSKITSGKKG
jgi:hypothetical protein